MTKKEVLELRGKALARLEALNAEIGDGVETAEQTAELNKLNGELDGYEAQLSALDDANARAAARTAALEERKAKAFNVNVGARPGGNRNTTGKMSSDEVQAFSKNIFTAWANPTGASGDVIEDARAFGIDPMAKEIRLGLTPSEYLKDGEKGVRRFAQGISQIQTGGALLMPGLLGALETALSAFGGLRQYANVIRTSKSTDLIIPTLNATGTSASIVGENTAVSSTSLSFGQVKIGNNKWSPGYVPVSRELLRDSEVAVDSIIGNVLGESFGRGQAPYFLTGTGASQPKGLLTAAQNGKTTAGATAITGDEVKDLITSLDPAYRASGAVLLMHDNIARYLTKLKGGDGQYLFQRDLTGQRPNTFDGFPIAIDNSMQSSVATGTKTIAFGVLSKYVIRDVNTIRMQRLTELHALSDQDSFVAFMETDANLVDAGTYPVKYLLQA